MNLLKVAIGAAQSVTAGPVCPLLGSPRNATIQANFTYGSGGATVDAYIQTSFDNGATWCDAANFHFTTASVRALVNLASQTPVVSQTYATDGALAANTTRDGIMGPQWRVKWVSIGTYSNTTLTIDMHGDQIPVGR